MSIAGRTLENMDNRSFSVAMSVYKNDNPKHFKTALDSVLQQTVKPSEVILVVDGPIGIKLTDIIENYKMKYECIKVIWQKTNLGLGNALRVAVENSSYELIARMDSDDIAVHDRFEQQLLEFEKDRDLDIVGGDINEFINGVDDVVGIRKVPTDNVEIYKYMKKRCAMNHVTVMFKKSSVQKAGGYIELFCNEDYYLWIRMCLKNCKFANTGTNLVNVRVGDDMYQRRGGKKYFKSEMQIQRFMLKQGFISLYQFIINSMKRFCVQILLPNKLRGKVYQIFARS